MANKTIENYVNRRYARWLDYATFHCSQQKLEGQANDVLDEVLLMLLKKPDDLLLSLFKRKRFDKKMNMEVTELDFFILKMLYLNITSPTAPYRHKTRPVPSDANADLSRMEIMDEEETEDDTPGRVVDQMRRVREALDILNITQREREVFEWKFFHGNMVSEWPGPEAQTDVYETIQWVEDMLKAFLTGVKREKPTPSKRLRSPEPEQQAKLF